MSSNLKNDLSNAGKHDFIRAAGYPGAATTSVGIFQWVLTSNGKRLKKTGAKVRVKGPNYKPESINRAAQKIREELDAGTYKGKKTVTVS